MDKILICCCYLILVFCTLSDFANSSILIRGGMVVKLDEVSVEDVFIEGEKIKIIGKNLSENADTIIDASGMYVMPGGIDPHTHFGMLFMNSSSCDDFTTGHKAAIAGGTTSHIDFALPLEDSLIKNFEIYKKKIKEEGLIDGALHVCVKHWNASVAREMEILTNREGVNSYKFFMAYKNALMIDDATLLQAMRKAKELGALSLVHAENGDAVEEGRRHVAEDLGILSPIGHALSRPDYIETEATHRAITFAKLLKAPLYIVHVMNKYAAEVIRSAREEGHKVFGEAVLPGLTLDESGMRSSNFTIASAHVMSPPIREHAVHGVALQDALLNGGLQLVGTDHAAFTSSQKALGIDDFRLIPNGISGVQERIPILWELFVHQKGMHVKDFARIVSTEAAKIFNIFPQKGVIAEGSDADLYVFNRNDSYVINPDVSYTKNDVNVYNGFKLSGRVVLTTSRGEMLYQNGTFMNLRKGRAKYIHRRPFCPYVFGDKNATSKLEANEGEASPAGVCTLHSNPICTSDFSL